MITVHHVDNSRSQRVLWLLEELGVDYEIKRSRRNPKTMLAPASLREVHPLGKSPVITEGPHTIAESGAIIEYLVDRHGGGRLVPRPGTPERLRYTYWRHYSEGSAMPPLLLSLVFDRIEAAVARAGLNARRPRLMDFPERIHARPAYARALERGGPYQLARSKEG
jgi:glutathione S-transferase